MSSNETTKERFQDPNFQYGRWLSSPPPGDEVTISGMSGRLPKSKNIHEFRDNLFNKIEMLTEDRRWNLRRQDIPPKGGKIPNIDKYDAGYFGLHYRQVHNMDPAARVFMETAIEAIMDAGVNPLELKGTKTGVFVGVCWSEMENSTLVNITEPQKFAITGYVRSMFAHRLSYALKLRGPSCILDTACSSSTYAVYTAFQSIRKGECENAIVGSCHLNLHPGTTVQFFRLGVLSPDGICKTFDQDADGYVRSEAANCLFLQKAKNSRRIYAQIINCKVSSNGFKEEGITFPSCEDQERLMVELYEESDVDPSELGYLEVHGTGTTVGDPEEIAAIDNALTKRRQKQLLVGSVKSSIGHSEPASGVSSIIKVLIAMETGLIGPNLNLKRIKSGMEGIEQGRMKVVTELTQVQEEDDVFAINSSGFGGSNGHIILRRYRRSKIINGLSKDDLPKLICISGRSEAGVAEMLKDIAKKSLDGEYVSLIHQLYKINIQNHMYRGYAIVSKQGVIAMSSKCLPSQRPILYVFFGQFVKRFRMLAVSMMKLSVFKTIIERINKILIFKGVKTFEEMVESGTEASDDILGAISTQIAIVDFLKIVEICPADVIGDKTGTIMKAYYYDDIQLEEAISIAIEISQRTIDCNKNYKALQKLQNFTLKEDYDHSPKVVTMNFSDSPLNNKDLMVVQGDIINLLNILGRLYIEGYLPQVQKLYPQADFPVRRGTTMISPSIQWDHTKSWYTFEFNEFAASDDEQKEFHIMLLYDEFKFISGHVIDGRNLFPATEYLNLVWQTFAQSRRLLSTFVPVIFENCKFIRAVTMPKNGFVKLHVMIQRGTGNFEVLEQNSVVVSGRIQLYEARKQRGADLEICDSFNDDPLETIEQEEIYRELYLRGYNYSGMFKAIKKCNVDASAALIKWENNWSSFMDNMLQMKIISTDSRELCVPVGIKKIVIDTVAHLDVVKHFDEENCLLPVQVNKDCGVIRSGGIEIHGLLAKSIFKKRPRLRPILEKHVFVPNCSSLEIADVIRINTQIILENSLENHFKAVEFIDEFSDHNSEDVLSLVLRTLEDVPVVTSDFTISSDTSISETPGIKLENVTLTPENNLLLIVGSKLLERLETLKQMFLSVSKNGFVLTRENLHFTKGTIDEIEIITEYTTSSEKFFLLRDKTKTVIPKCIEVSSYKFDWLVELQNSFNQDSNVIVYSKNEEPEGILGLINCIRREPNGKKVRCFFMMDEAPEFDPQNVFYSKQISKNLAVNIYKKGTWGTYRHLLLEQPSTIHCEHSYANVKNRGDISSFEWLEGSLTRQTPLQGEQFLVSTFYSAVNFKDIMVASGRINVSDFATDRRLQEVTIALEFSGKDLSGRRVTGMTDNHGISTNVAFDPFLSWEVPHSWTLEDAATVPVVYSTVVYALLMVRELKLNSSILIHSATGGIGLAALNVCLHYKCDIYVTVGTEEKRGYLKKHYPQIPSSHIGNSRDTSFEQMIKKETKNRGVDIVLNSLSDDKLQASIRCLARGGRFMEIGKYDLTKDTALDLMIIERGASFHGVHLDEIFKCSKERKNEINKVIRNGIKSGFVKPLPRVVFNADQVTESYRYMMTGKHIGKVLIKLRDEDKTSVDVNKIQQFKANPRFNCDVRYSYIIIGGLGGVGLELADWLVLRGAKKLVLVSRSGIQSGYQKQRISIWQSYGVQVKVSTQKLTTRQGCEDLIKEANQLGQVDAIFNLAVVLQDSLIGDQTKESFLISLEPKAVATIHLDQVTRQLCPNLRYFVIFSSVSCGRGNAGQSNYGMANSVMERICEKRRSEGLPAVAIQWGAIGDVGLVAKMQKENKELIIGGTLQQKISSCLEVLDKLLKQEHPVVSSMVVAEKNYQSDNLITPTQAVAQILGVQDIKTISYQSTLAELGMDSMMGTEVMQVLEKDYEIYLTSKDVRSLTFAKLKEIEEEAKNRSEDTNLDKAQQGANMVIQYIPDFENSHLPVVTLPSKAVKEKSPVVFLLPGVEGSCKPLEILTSEMKARTLGIQYAHKYSENSIQEMAKNITSNIESYLSKSTPFVIVGYSFGTAVGLDLVSLLEDKGYSGSIILIDGSPTYSSSSVKKHFRYEEEATFRLDYVLKMFSFALPLETLDQHRETFIKCKDLEQQIDFGLTLVPAEIRNRQKIEKQALVAIYQRLKAIVNYKFTNKKITSPVYLFKAKYSMVEEDNDYQLSKVCANVVKVATIDGDHVSILNKSELCEAINEIVTLQLRL